MNTETPMPQSGPSAPKPWYFTWWGVLLVIGLFYIFVPYFVWKQTSWPKWLKIGVTAVCALFVISIFVGGMQNVEKSSQLVKQAETHIQNGDVDKAETALNEAQNLASSEEANKLLELIEQYHSDKLLDKTLLAMSYADYGQLLRGELDKKYIAHEALNALFIARLKENGARRSELTKAAYDKKQKEKAAKRKKRIEAGFSSWDGAHHKLTKTIKGSMNDPKSFEHAGTTYRDMGDYLMVTETFRGKNAFGGVVKNTVIAKCSIDGDVLEVIDQF